MLHTKLLFKNKWLINDLIAWAPKISPFRRSLRTHAIDKLHGPDANKSDDHGDELYELICMGYQCNWNQLHGLPMQMRHFFVPYK